MTPLLFFGTLCVFIIRSYTLVRQIERGQKKGAATEAGAGAEGGTVESADEPVPDSAATVSDEEKAEPAKGSAPAQA